MSSDAFPTPLTIAQAADLAGVHYDTVRKAIKRGEIPGYTMPGGREIRVRPDDLEAWIYSDRVPVTAPQRPQRAQIASRDRPATGSVAALDAIEGATAA